MCCRLPEVFAEMKGIKAEKPLDTKIVRDIYSKAISFFGNEFDILHHVPLDDLHRYYPNLSVAIERLRNNQKHFTAGYDGEYGRIYFFNEGELNAKQKQMELF